MGNWGTHNRLYSEWRTTSTRIKSLLGRMRLRCSPTKLDDGDGFSSAISSAEVISSAGIDLPIDRSRTAMMTNKQTNNEPTATYAGTNKGTGSRC